MRRYVHATMISMFLLGAVLPGYSDDEVLLETRWSEVDFAADAPVDLVSPEGKSRWDLTGIALSGKRVRIISRVDGDGDALDLVERVLGAAGASRTRLRFTDPARGDAVERWLVPHREDVYLDGSQTAPLGLEVREGERVRHLWIRIERMGQGWLHLPSGPRRTVLQRALILSRDEGSRSWTPEKIKRGGRFIG